jgi:hypothetical protein
VLLKFIDQLRKCNGRLAVLTPSSRRRLRRHHRRLLCRRLHLPLRLLPRLAPVEGGHRQLPTDQKGPSRGILDVCCSCPMVPLLPLRKRSVPNVPEGGTLRAAGPASAAEQSRWTANSARWGVLTFDTKGEIIICVGRNSRFARPLDAVLALLAHLFFLHIGLCLLRIRNS